MCIFELKRLAKLRLPLSDDSCFSPPWCFSLATYSPQMTCTIIPAKLHTTVMRSRQTLQMSTSLHHAQMLATAWDRSTKQRQASYVLVKCCRRSSITSCLRSITPVTNWSSCYINCSSSKLRDPTAHSATGKRFLKSKLTEGGDHIGDAKNLDCQLGS